MIYQVENRMIIDEKDNNNDKAENGSNETDVSNSAEKEDDNKPTS